MLALQIGLIDQGQLVAAFQAWARDKARSIADHLLDRGSLDAEQRAVVEAMVALHLKKHGGDTEQSLAALGAGRLTRERLAAVGDPGLDTSLASVGAATNGQRRPRPHRELRCRRRHQRRPAVPRLAAPRPGGTRGGLRRARRGAAPRGGLEADPGPARRRPGQPRPVRARGGGDRRARTPGDRPGLRPGYRRRRTSLLRHAVHPWRQPQGRHRRLPRRRVARGRPRPPVAGTAQAAAAIPRRLQRHRVCPPARGVASGFEARQRDGRQVRRDAGGGLGTGQGRRPVRPRRGDRRADAGAIVLERGRRDAPGLGGRHAGVHEPRASGRRPRPARPALGRLQPGRHALLPADRQAALPRRRPRGHAEGRAAGRIPRPPVGGPVDRAGARGGV